MGRKRCYSILMFNQGISRKKRIQRRTFSGNIKEPRQRRPRPAAHDQRTTTVDPQTRDLAFHRRNYIHILIFDKIV